MDNIDITNLVAELMAARYEVDKANSKAKEIEKKLIRKKFPNEVYIRMDGDVFKVEVSPIGVKISQIDII